MKNIMKNYLAKFNRIKSIVQKDDPIIVEIGAHYGEDSMRMLEIFPKSIIYCFEPDPRNITIFKKHVNSDQIKLIELAVSNENGKAEFFQSFSNELPESTFQKYDWIDKEDYVNLELNQSGASSLKKSKYFTLESPIEVTTIRF